jgi:hypothetical protein
MFAPAIKLTLLEEPFNEKLVAAGTVGPTRVSDDAPELIVRLAPATRLTLLDEPLSAKFVAVGTVGPINVNDDAPELIVRFDPATSDTLPVVPFNVKSVPPPVPPDAAFMVIDDAFVDNVTLEPATSWLRSSTSVQSVSWVRPRTRVLIS